MKKLNEYTFDDIKVGLAETFEHRITENDIDIFGELTGDFNPLHYDEEYTKATRFKGRIVQGLLTASFISRTIGMLLPGKHALYLSQELKFIKPVKPGDILKITGTVIEKIAKGKILSQY